MWSLIQDHTAGFPRSYIPAQRLGALQTAMVSSKDRHKIGSQGPGGHCLGHSTQSNTLRSVFKFPRTQACRMSPYLQIDRGRCQQV